MRFYYKGEIYPFVSARDLIKFKPLKMINRIRLGLASLLMMRINDWRTIEKRGALEWLRQYAGEEACRIIWEPLLKMKFGDDYEKISAAWLWNRVVDRKGNGGGDVLGYVKGGYKVLLDGLAERIRKNGGRIETGTPVEKIDVT